jgi:hypothetical protein
MSYQIVRLCGGMPHRSFHVNTKRKPLASVLNFLYKKFFDGGYYFCTGGCLLSEGGWVAGIEKRCLLCD